MLKRDLDYVWNVYFWMKSVFLALSPSILNVFLYVVLHVKQGAAVKELRRDQRCGFRYVCQAILTRGKIWSR